MGLAAGSRIGAYEVTATLGAGGMGEVYRARDTVLKRDVALKVLPDSFTRDPDRLARFQREAELLASLNHPHIAHIHGLETSEGVRALVLEFVDGPTLADRIAQGPIPIDEALPIAQQIAEAIEAAHEQGIIHRDLKPANIKVTVSGAVKVLDFGLARALGDGEGPIRSDAANSPTLSLAATRAGVILGTAAYMSPEQAKGKPVDRRSDIWSFGIVLFEMLTGRAVYSGETISETMAHVITRDPDWTTLPAYTPSRIRALLGRCLIKDPRRRLQAIGEARIALEEGSDQPAIDRGASSIQTAQAYGSRRRRALLAVVALALVAAAIAIARDRVSFAGTAAPAPTRRFTITLPESDSLPPATGSLLALSPDGRTLVYAAARGAQRLLFRRSLDQFDATPIVGSEDGRDPFFSPDGQWIGFIADRVLRKAPLAGGAAQSILSDSAARGSTWTPDGRILFTSNISAGSLNQMSAAGGATTTLFTSPDQRAVWYPQFIPDSNAVVFTLSERSPDAGELHAVRLDTGEHRTVVPNAAAGRVLHTGHLVFVRSASLWAVRFDRRRLEIIGEPLPVVEGVKVEPGGAVQYAVADDGSLAYIPGSAAGQGRGLVLVDRKGTSQRLPAPAREYGNLAWSPDQTRVAVQVDDNERADVWVADPRGTLARLTAESGFDGYPLWTLDGGLVVFASMRDGRWQLRRRASDGTGETTVLARFDEGVASVRPYSWSPDGETLLFDMRTGSNQNDIGVLPMKGNGRWNALIATASNESQPAVSPDGRWIAYTSTESGVSEVFLQRFPMLGDRRLVSVGVGHSSSWARDGRTLYYLRGGPPDAVMRVAIETGRNAGALTIGAPEVFQPFRYYSRPTLGRPYGVSHDGDRLLAIGLQAADARPPREIHVVLNWSEELKRLVPIK